MTVLPMMIAPALRSSGDDLSIAHCRWSSFANDRTSQCRFASDIEKILDRNNPAVDGTKSVSIFRALVSGICLLAGGIRIKLCKNPLIACTLGKTSQNVFEPLTG